VTATAPIVDVSSPIDGLITSNATIHVAGTVSNTVTTLTVNGARVKVKNNAFATDVTLQEGANTITIVARDNNGTVTTIVRQVIKDTQAPVVTITLPLNNSITNQLAVNVSGTVTDATAITLVINNNPVSITSGGAFQTNVALTEGKNNITVTATDAAGNITKTTKTVIKDTQPPIVIIASPVDNLITNVSSLSMNGTINDSTACTLTIDGTSVPIATGAFNYQLSLIEGQNIITVIATDAAGNTTSVTRSIRLDTQAPVCILQSPLDGLVTNHPVLAMKGIVTDSTKISLVVNGIAQVLKSDESFIDSIKLSEGLNTITVTATDVAGNTSTTVRAVLLDTQPPVVTIIVPPDSSVTNNPFVPINGTVTDLTAITLTINGTSVPISNGAFNSNVHLSDGFNIIQLIASDSLGNSTIISRTIQLDTTPPVIANLSPLSNTTLYDSDSIITVSGTVIDKSKVIVFANYLEATLGSNNTFTVLVPVSKGKNSILVEVTDIAGNKTDSMRTIKFIPVPPDPAKVAPKVDQTVITGVATGTKFLYTGSNPIQTSVDTSMLEPVRLSVIRGKVFARDLSPLPGVTVSILDHPEFGQTITRKDGMYDMVVNGGGQITLVFTRDGYISVQRQCSPEWQKYTRVDDATLLFLDPVVTTAVLSDSQAIVARGSVVIDQDGKRQSTILIKPGTQAVMKTIHYMYEKIGSGDGAKIIKVPTDTVYQKLDTLSIRATEFTVGHNGQKSMPAPLPPASSYTYCVELSADEVNNAGATSLEFSNPVPMYLENFLNIPAGTIIPAGYYDRNRGCWVAEHNGIVIQIIGIDNGYASVDVDGDGIAEDTAGLAIYEIDSTELKNLASLYTPGQTLWRVPVSHFSEHDYNYSGSTVGDGTADTLDVSGENLESTLEDGTSCGSIIGIRDQTLGEALSITGTPYSLYYNTARTLGYKPANSLSLPLTGDTLPKGITGVELDVQIAGKEYDTTYAPQTNLTAFYQWDGKDAYDRQINGKQAVDVHIGYKYNAVYLSPIEHYDHPAFGQPGNTALTNGRGDAMAWRNWSSYLGINKNVLGDLGGWNLDIHHLYDFNEKNLYYGNGTKRSTNPFTPDVTILDGTIGSGAIAMAIDPKGNLYFTRSNTNQVWMRSPNGAIYLIAGTGEQGYSGDGNAATYAQLNMPQGLAIGSDGSIYVSDGNNNVIRKISPDGIISTFAGNGGSGYSGDGDMAINAQMDYPCGLAFGPEGSLYIADNGNHCIRVVHTSGLISTLAGNGTAGFSGDGGPASQAQLQYPCGVAVDNSGNVFIADTWNRCVRKVNSSGIISTCAGIGENSGDTGDGGLATNALFWAPYSIAINSSGDMYIVDDYSLRRIDAQGYISTIYGGNESYQVVVSHDGGLYLSSEVSCIVCNNQNYTNKLLASTVTLNCYDWYI
jgi:sugar lactone lactonase YvrE